MCYTFNESLFRVIHLFIKSIYVSIILLSVNLADVLCSRNPGVGVNKGKKTIALLLRLQGA